MAEFDTIIRNGSIATASDVFDSDIGIKDGIITALSNNLSDADEIIDAKGMYVLPGGVDAHVHLDEPPFYDVLLNDSYESGTIAAAHGGTTTIVTFALQKKGRKLRDCFNDYHKKADDNAVIDYGFHMILTDPTEQVVNEEIPELIADGYTSYKCFMAYDGALNDTQILDTIDIAKKHGGLVMIHAENEHCRHNLSTKLLDERKTSVQYYPDMAPMAVEREATHRAITFSEITDTPILLVHVSAREAMDQIRWGQDRGLKIYAETCPQYMFLTNDVFKKEGWEAAKYVCSPPPHDTDNQEALWRGIANGVFQLVSSDHNAFQFDSEGGKKVGGGNAPHFAKVPPGIPGIEPRLALMFSEGVNGNRIGINIFVATTSTNPAKIYGMYPKKGTIAIGSDADISIWDPDKKVKLKHDILHEDVDFTPYEGLDVVGWPVKVMSRGQVLVSDGEFIGEKGCGQFLRRDRINLNPPRGKRTEADVTEDTTTRASEIGEPACKEAA